MAANDMELDRPKDDRSIDSRVLGRRDVLRGLAGLAGLVTLPTLVSACSSSAGMPNASAKAISQQPTSASSAAQPLKPGLSLAAGEFGDAMADILRAFKAATGITVKLKSVDQNALGESIESYLTGSPEDVITWVPGYRMRAMAAKGLLTPIDDVWTRIATRYSAGVKAGSTGDDGHQYAMPFAVAPWAVVYRKSLFAKRKYDIPMTWADFKALAGRMQRDGLIPIAMGDQERFPAMATFDLLDMRENGVAFHLDLLTGKEKWADRRVRRVFELWREIMPFTEAGATGRSMGDAAEEIIRRQAGMHVTSSWGALASDTAQPADLEDLDMFAFPTLGTEFDHEKAVDAPLDGFMVTSRSPSFAADLDNAKAFIEFLSLASTQALAIGTSRVAIAPARDADMNRYSGLQRSAATIVNAANRTTQFLDRDTDYGFAGHVGDSLADFLTNPDLDLDPFLAQIQDFWDAT